MERNTKNIFHIMDQYAKMRDKAIRLKEDEATRKKSFYFGITSFFKSIAAIAFCLLGSWIFQLNADYLFFTIFAGLGFIFIGLILCIMALVRLILQFSINKNWASWLSLIGFLGSILGSITGIILLWMM